MTIELKNYTILKECKGNQSNKVFVVEEKSSGHVMILKLIKIYDRDKQMREVEIHKRLNHKFVIKMVDFDLQKTHVVLLIEYAKYGDLFSVLGKLREIPERRLLKFFYQFVEAIEYLHMQGFVHRDIKPENILITKKFSPRLADFGTSSALEVVKNTFCGTYEYMAPEIYLRESQSSKVDIWAIGVLLFEMTHQFTPFKKESVSGIKSMLDENRIRFRHDLNPQIKALILRILKYSADQRPTAREILQDPIFADFRQTVTSAAASGDQTNLNSTTNANPDSNPNANTNTKINSGSDKSEPKTSSEESPAKSKTISDSFNIIMFKPLQAASLKNKDTEKDKVLKNVRSEQTIQIVTEQKTNDHHLPTKKLWTLNYRTLSKPELPLTSTSVLEPRKPTNSLANSLTIVHTPKFSSSKANAEPTKSSLLNQYESTVRMVFRNPGSQVAVAASAKSLKNMAASFHSPRNVRPPSTSGNLKPPAFNGQNKANASSHTLQAILARYGKTPAMHSENKFKVTASSTNLSNPVVRKPAFVASMVLDSLGSKQANYLAKKAGGFIITQKTGVAKANVASSIDELN